MESKITIYDLYVLLFVGLKLAGFIDWGWFWVLVPYWVGIAWTVMVVIVKNSKRAKLHRMAGDLMKELFVEKLSKLADEDDV